MVVLLLTLALTTASGQLPVPASPGELLGDTVELKGDLRVETEPGVLIVARKNAVLRSGTSVIRADEISYNHTTQVAEARGNVLLVMRGLVGFAERLTLDRQTRTLTAENANGEGAAFVQKENVTPEELAAQETAEQLAKVGKNAFSFTTRGLRIEEDGSYVLEESSFTPCDCDVTTPTWRISTSSAKLKPDESATLTLPAVRVYGVPVLLLPWVYLPLAQRASGLLLPEVTGSGLSGFQLDQPVFLTLGRSYDLTLSPGYAFGTEPADPTRGSLGVKGPRLSTELRYVPLADPEGHPAMEGRLWMQLVYDLKPERDPLNYNVLAPGAPPRGLRGWGLLEHRQKLGNDFFARADVKLFSDGFLFADTTTNSAFARSYYYVPSTATVYHRGTDDYAGLALAYRQDIRWGHPLFGDAPRPPVFQELPTLRYALPTVPLLGPLSGGVEVELSRLSPIDGLLGDEGTDGIHWPLLPDADGTQGNGRFDPGERQARTRLDVMPRVNATFDLGGVLRLTPYLAVRESLYLYEATRETNHRGYGMVGAHLDTELSRVFGEGANALRHSIRPSVEVRAVPHVFGQGSPQVYDEVDAAVPANGFFQGQVALRQKLLARAGPSGTRELGRLDVVQSVDFLERRLGETSGRILAVLGPVTAEARGRLDLFTPETEERLTQVSARIGWSIIPDRLSVSTGYERALASSEQVRRPIDMLLPPPLAPQEPGPSAGASCSSADAFINKPIDHLLLGAETRLPFGLNVGYGAEVQRKDPARCDVAELFSQTLSVSFSPSCDCWRLNSWARVGPGTSFDWGLSVTVLNLGTFGR
ncbi:LPS-assembly protein [Archangium gephyra]|uniref:LPS-assembly protein n=1 Tax=Archangium gephyra TaxID=48 RepID=A0AAC8QAT7_9BACT|nr:LPS assembly protein LptD [Archangium gephyra]AKJ03666.1 Outer membrane protein Imp, required for envelope biogenesis / Organic solvent tolerance protein precursor [Archangium gephyra]REG22554.1 LPS-assembly protein [Archangium gephyra]